MDNIDFSNPIFDPILRKQIIDLCKDTGIEITSISLDLLMQKTLDKFSNEEINWIFDNIDSIAESVGLIRVSIPVDKTSGIKSEKEFN